MYVINMGSMTPHWPVMLSENKLTHGQACFLWIIWPWCPNTWGLFKSNISILHSLYGWLFLYNTNFFKNTCFISPCTWPGKRVISRGFIVVFIVSEVSLDVLFYLLIYFRRTCRTSPPVYYCIDHITYYRFKNSKF